MDDRLTDKPGSVADLGSRYVDAVGRTTVEILGEGLSTAKVEEAAMVAARYADGEIESWAARPDSPTGIACRAGCSACCHSPVAIAIPEAILMANTLLAESTDEELAIVLDKVRQAADARSGLIGEARDRSIHPCPMLDDAGSCSIYEFRPLNCRGWASLDVSRCEAYLHNPAQGISIPIDGVRRTIGQSIAFGLQQGLESRGLEHTWVDLSAALRIVLEDPSAVDRWLEGEPAFREAEVLIDAPRG